MKPPLLPILVLCLSAFASDAQPLPSPGTPLSSDTSAAAYTPDWESLDTRPVPAWFGDAKFGIFIHWGLYSVPAWSPKGTYAEWYEYWLEHKTLFGNGEFTGTEIYDYHRKTYGEAFAYADFAPLFRASDFDADAWAALFRRAGAKYAVLTTKHHEGFALWPSREASQAYGRAWNSLETGPRRDLVGEYAAALRRQGLKVGCYFSLREWNNPLYTPRTMDTFYERHFLPQLQDLVTRYEPDLVWADGPDALDDQTWQVERTLAWLYSESPVRDSIVVNDRWANNTGGRHGDFYTREYSSGTPAAGKPWEECRGIGFSFGLNRNEDLEDYALPQALVLTLVNTVSQGGNLLLGIGPDANGKIPPLMQERLVQMGDWLRVNGEAIYGTRPWKRPFQWSEGDRTWKPAGKHYVGGNEILRQTTAPEPGHAVKQAFFTRRGDTVYAILPVYPRQVLRLEGVKATPATRIALLGSDREVGWEQQGEDLLVRLPQLRCDEMPCSYAWTLRLEAVD